MVGNVGIYSAIRKCQYTGVYDTEMIERLGIEGCQSWHSGMKQTLKANAAEFLGSVYIQDFEKEWMKCYI